MINLKVRLKNKIFWMSIIPAALILVQQICELFGISLDVSAISEKLIAIVGTIFAVLSLIGVVNDPTTEGLSDSEQALTYEKPKSN